MRSVELQLRAPARQIPEVRKPQTIPGIGPITGTALVALIGDVRKKGDVYLRMLLTHGARAVLWKARSRENPDRLRARALRLEKLRGHNKTTIALADKIARIVWSVWRRDAEFTEEQLPVIAGSGPDYHGRRRHSHPGLLREQRKDGVPDLTGIVHEENLWEESRYGLSAGGVSTLEPTTQ